MDFKELIDYCQIQAIASAIEPTELSVWRSLCRSYSKKFNTELSKVLLMDPEEVLLAEFEDQLEDLDLDKDLPAILEKIYFIEDPLYEDEKRKELDDFMEKANKEEALRIKEGRPIHKALKKEVTLKNDNLPKSGKIDLSYLQAEENSYSKYEE